MARSISARAICGFVRAVRYLAGSSLQPSPLCAATYRIRAFLGYCSAVDHQQGIAAADQPIHLNKQFHLHRLRISDPGRNEVVQLIVFAKLKPLRHRLSALAAARGGGFTSKIHYLGDARSRTIAFDR